MATRSARSSASSWSWVTKTGRHAGAVVEVAQPAAQVAAHLGVQRPERFVQQQHARFDGQGAGQGHPLALAAGQLGREALVQPLQLHERQEVADPILDLGLARPLASRPHRRPKAMFWATVMCRKRA
jgi:hypothetical protein